MRRQEIWEITSISSLIVFCSSLCSSFIAYRSLTTSSSAVQALCKFKKLFTKPVCSMSATSTALKVQQFPNQPFVLAYMGHGFFSKVERSLERIYQTPIPIFGAYCTLNRRKKGAAAFCFTPLRLRKPTSGTPSAAGPERFPKGGSI